MHFFINSLLFCWTLYIRYNPYFVQTLLPHKSTLIHDARHSPRVQVAHIITFQINKNIVRPLFATRWNKREKLNVTLIL